MDIKFYLLFVFGALFIRVNGYPDTFKSSDRNAVIPEFPNYEHHDKDIHIEKHEEKGSDENDDDKIIGGNEVDITQFPHQVGLLNLNLKPTDSICGGSIISDKFILTAAHCVAGNQNPSIYRIRAGSTYNGNGGVLYNVLTITVHPHYKGLITIYDYDVAVLGTRERIGINGVTTKIVQLAPAGSRLMPGEILTASGWGDTTPGHEQYSRVLKAVSIPVVDHGKCRNAWPNLTDRMICAGYDQPGQTACRGDSGGPVINQQYVQYGIVSYGPKGCVKPNTPTIFASVPALRGWIQQVSGV